MYLGVICIGEWLKELIPFRLVLPDAMTEACRYFQVVEFGLSVGLQIVWGCRLSSDTEIVAHILPEFGNELGAFT